MAAIFGVLFIIVFGVGLLGVMGAGGYVGVQGLLDLFITLDPQVAILTATFSIVALLCANIVTGGLKWRGQKEKEMQLRAEKADVYEKILMCWGEVLSTRTTSREPSLLENLHKLERVLILRGSGRVIKLYSDVQACVSRPSAHSSELPSLVAKLALEMRRDLGQSVFSITERELAHLFKNELFLESSSGPPMTGQAHVSLSPGV